MFQPFNESFIRSNVESTIDHRADETEEQRILRQEQQAYQTTRATFSLHHFIHAIGHALLSVGNRLEEIGTRETRMAHQHGMSK